MDNFLKTALLVLAIMAGVVVLISLLFVAEQTLVAPMSALFFRSLAIAFGFAVVAVVLLVIRRTLGNAAS